MKEQEDKYFAYILGDKSFSCNLDSIKLVEIRETDIPKEYFVCLFYKKEEQQTTFPDIEISFTNKEEAEFFYNKFSLYIKKNNVGIKRIK